MAEAVGNETRQMHLFGTLGAMIQHFRCESFIKGQSLQPHWVGMQYKFRSNEGLLRGMTAKNPHG